MSVIVTLDGRERLIRCAIEDASSAGTMAMAPDAWSICSEPGGGVTCCRRRDRHVRTERAGCIVLTTARPAAFFPCQLVGYQRFVHSWYQ